MDCSRVCPKCRRSLMELHLQSPSKFMNDENDNIGNKLGHWYWICKLLECNYRLEISQGRQPNVGLLPQPQGDIKSPLICMPVKRRRKSSDTDATDEDIEDISNFLGYTPQSVTIVNSLEDVPTPW